MAVRVVTDSTADLPSGLAQKLGIAVVPLNVHFGSQVFQDGVELSHEEFYRRLVSEPRLPTTSQPSVGTFLDIYRSLAEGAEGIVSIHISAKVSGTWNSAHQAAQEIQGRCPIAVVDSRQVSLGVGLVALAAARLSQAGASYDQVVAEANKASGEVAVLSLLDTLEYLERGGRIGKARAFLGSLLHIKPILTVKEGEAYPLERVRSRSRGVERLVGLVKEAAPLADLAVLHTTSQEEAQALAERVQPFLPDRQVHVARHSPVMGTYLGPGALGVAYRQAR
ncbi:MAG: DegV family protein [Chloroflexi bacterium]|nr:DegV family protein [Chloroflexota bacterium]